jgi:hypothetical protein
VEERHQQRDDDPRAGGAGMTDLQTLQAQVNYLSARIDGLAGRATTVMATNVPASPAVVAGTSFANLTAAYPIPGGDPAAGTVYRLTLWGDFNTGTNAVNTCTWSIAAYGLNAFSAAPPAAVGLGQAPQSGANVGLGARLEYKLSATLLFQAAGASASMATFMDGGLAICHNSMSNPFNVGNDNDFNLAGGAAGAVPVDTTADTTFAVQAAWAATATAQTVRCFGSMLERYGP